MRRYLSLDTLGSQVLLARAMLPTAFVLGRSLAFPFKSVPFQALSGLVGCTHEGLKQSLF